MFSNRVTPLRAVAILLFTASAGAQIVVTGNSSLVTKPSFPAVCTQLSAAITQVGNDMPAAIDIPGSYTARYGTDSGGSQCLLRHRPYNTMFSSHRKKGSVYAPAHSTVLDAN